jgi:hypothetical protein
LPIDASFPHVRATQPGLDLIRSPVRPASAHLDNSTTALCCIMLALSVVRPGTLPSGGQDEPANLPIHIKQGAEAVAAERSRGTTCACTWSAPPRVAVLVDASPKWFLIACASAFPYPCVSLISLLRRRSWLLVGTS